MIAIKERSAMREKGCMLPSTILLPQSPQSFLNSPTDRVRILKLKKVLLDEAIQAIEDFFIYQRMDRFDAHVGENACQIRSYHIFLLKSNLDNYYCIDNIDKQIATLRHSSDKVAKAIENCQCQNQQKEKRKTLDEFLKEKDLICDISEFSLYLAQLHFLSRFKMLDEDGSASIDCHMICNMFGISRHIAEKIIHIYQKDISKQSANFISSLMHDKNYNLVNFFKKIDGDGRFTLPCYWVMDVLYKDMLKRKFPILVICRRRVKQEYIDTIFITFKVSPVKKDYEYSQLSNADPNSLYFVIAGFANYNELTSVPDKPEYTQSFISHGIRNVLFANMAIHPQYSGKKLSQDRNTPFLDLLEEKKSLISPLSEEMTLLKELHNKQQYMINYARRVGCGRDNSGLFCVQHILCDTLSNQVHLNKLYQRKRKVAISETLSSSNDVISISNQEVVQ